LEFELLAEEPTLDELDLAESLLADWLEAVAPLLAELAGDEAGLDELELVAALDEVAPESVAELPDPVLLAASLL
jgi:hypothetical protein